MSPGLLVWATPAQLGPPDIARCNIDGIERIYEPGTPFALLFTTDERAPCGLDPGDIYASNLAGNYWLYADDVADLKIAISENDPVDIDALAVNTGGDFQIDGPYEPPDPTFFKADWPNYAPSGMPDFEQDHANWPPTYCGPTAVADSLWWFDSELECERDRQRGDAAETESNDTCNLADSLGEFPPIPGAFAAATYTDWYVFDVPTRIQSTCTATISTCRVDAGV